MKFWQPKQPDADGFYETGVTAVSLQTRPMQTVKINKKKIVLARYEEKLVAFDSSCPHAAADLSKGDMHRWKLTCPDHSYCFDVRNGRVLWPEDEVVRLKFFEIKIADGLVKLKLN